MRTFLLELYNQGSVHDFTQFSKSKSEARTAWQNKNCGTELDTFKKKMEYLPDFRCQGVALGQAFASHISGDTVATVLVGGMATVMNGHFEMFSGILQRRVVACVVTSAVACISNTVSGTGDDVQWYFDFERPKFQAVTNHQVDQGCRIIDGVKQEVLDQNTQLHQNKKMKFFDHRLMGSQSGIGNPQGMKSGDTVFRIKPYRPSVIKENNSVFSMPHYGDKIRVFAKCIVGGRPGDMVDIMIMTQSS
jgi:predicted small secreted protein